MKLTALISLLLGAAVAINNPVIGILTLPSDFTKDWDPTQYSYIGASYVKSLESAGA
jgi:hypothetical protein